MQQAKREGEWFVVGVMGGSIVTIYTAPVVITYGSVAIAAEAELLALYGTGAFKASMASTSGSIMLKTTLDITAQGLFKPAGEINPLASLAGAIVPGGSTWKSAFSAGIVNEATNLTMRELSDPGSVSTKDIITSGVKSAVAAPAGEYMNGFIRSATGSNAAGEVGGAIFSTYTSSVLDENK